MAVDTSISDMAWLTQPAQAGASFLRGAQAGSLVNENWRQNRELQIREMLAPLQRRAFQLQAENQALDIATKMRAEDDLTADKAAYMEWAPKAAQDPNLPIPAFRTSVYQQQAIGLRKSSGDLMLNKIKTDQNIGFINAAQKLMEDGFGNELIIDYDDQGFLTPESRDSIQQAAAARRSEELKKFETRWGSPDDIAKASFVQQMTTLRSELVTARSIPDPAERAREMARIRKDVSELTRKYNRVIGIEDMALEEPAVPDMPKEPSKAEQLLQTMQENLDVAKMNGETFGHFDANGAFNSDFRVSPWSKSIEDLQKEINDKRKSIGGATESRSTPSGGVILKRSDIFKK